MGSKTSKQVQNSEKEKETKFWCGKRDQDPDKYLETKYHKGGEQVQKPYKNKKIEYHEGDTQGQNSDMNTETKLLGCSKIFIGCKDGHVQEFSMAENKTVHDFGKISNYEISLMAKTSDNKS